MSATDFQNGFVCGMATKGLIQNVKGADRWGMFVGVVTSIVNPRGLTGVLLEPTTGVVTQVQTYAEYTA